MALMAIVAAATLLFAGAVYAALQYSDNRLLSATSYNGAESYLKGTPTFAVSSGTSGTIKVSGYWTGSQAAGNYLRVRVFTGTGALYAKRDFALSQTERTFS